MVFSSLVGCGKSEQTEQEKLAEKINSEIAKDEQAQSEWEEQKVQINDVKETINNYKVQLSDILAEFNGGNDSVDYQSLADKYNGLYNEVEKYATENEQTNLLNNIHLKAIDQRFVNFKLNYLKIAGELDITTINYAYVEDSDTYILMLENNNNIYSHCTFLFEDGRTCFLDATDLISSNTIGLDWGEITESKVSFNYLESGTYIVYNYDITGETALQTGSGEGTSQQDSYEWVAGTTDISGVNNCVKDMMNNY